MGLNGCFRMHTCRCRSAADDPRVPDPTFGIPSSSCSYAAVALARSIFIKGASFVAAMTFELASTNLVVELGIILVVLMGWQFAVAEYVGGIVMVILLALVFRLTLTRPLV